MTLEPLQHGQKVAGKTAVFPRVAAVTANCLLSTFARARDGALPETLQPPATCQRHTIELVAMAHHAPPSIRLRQALKLALRGFNLRCVSIAEIPASDKSRNKNCA